MASSASLLVFILNSIENGILPKVTGLPVEIRANLLELLLHELRNISDEAHSLYQWVPRIIFGSDAYGDLDEGIFR